MSAGQTPALARADVLPLRLDLIETLGRWVNDACATEAVDEGLLPLLRRRLHDPDKGRDPVAEALCSHDESVHHMERTDDFPCSACVSAADAVRAAILGTEVA